MIGDTPKNRKTVLFVTIAVILLLWAATRLFAAYGRPDTGESCCGPASDERGLRYFLE